MVELEEAMADAEGMEEGLEGLEGLDELEGVDEAELANLEAELAGGEGLEGVEGAEEAEALPEEVPEEPAPEEEAHFDGVEVEEHLKDAVEGSLRLKRLLSRDNEEGPGKKRKLEPKDMKILKILNKWQLQQDVVVKFVLETCREELLDELVKSPYCPDKFNVWKSPAEILARYLAELRERSMPGGSACDAVSAFKFRNKLDFSTDKGLRALSHKDLRYVLTNYDGSRELSEVMEEAGITEPDDEISTASAAPKAPGVSTLGRFQRLELIDPLADAAIFGDANLTFALKLAKHRKALGHVGRIIATTFEEIDTLRERYKEIDSSISVLEDYYCDVYHGVDCTRIAIDPRFKGMEETFGSVYYNFPHSGAIQGFFDGHPVVNWRHENLMRLFFRALRSFMKPGGFVKVSSNMGAVGVRYSYIVGSALENEFIHVETMPFMEWHLHRYGRSYGDKRDIYKRPDAVNNQSYNAQAADRDMVYCFCYAPSGEPIGKQEVKLPPTLKTLRACTDGPFKNMQGQARENLAQSLHTRFVTEVSGTHVG